MEDISLEGTGVGDDMSSFDSPTDDDAVGIEAVAFYPSWFLICLDL